MIVIIRFAKSFTREPIDLDLCDRVLNCLLEIFGLDPSDHTSANLGDQAAKLKPSVNRLGRGFHDRSDPEAHANTSW